MTVRERFETMAREMGSTWEMVSALTLAQFAIMRARWRKETMR